MDMMKCLIELHREPLDKSYAVGDIYLAKAKKIVPGLNASFVDVGYEKDGFLHYLDLGPKFLTFQDFTQRNINKKISTASLKNFKLQKEIEKHEKDIETINTTFGKPDYYETTPPEELTALQIKKSKFESKLEDALSSWEEATKQLEEAQGRFEEAS